jgi:hypothetical protein
MTKEEVREQVQEDIRSYLDSDVCCGSLTPRDEIVDELCQIVVDNFKKLSDDACADAIHPRHFTKGIDLQSERRLED